MKQLGRNIKLYVNNSPINCEIEHSLQRTFDFLQKAGRSQALSYLRNNKSGSVSVRLFINYDDPIGYKTIVQIGETGAIDFFSIWDGDAASPRINFNGLISGYSQSAGVDGLAMFDFNILIDGDIEVLLAGAYQAESTNLDEITAYSAEVETASYTLRNVLAGTTQSGTLNFAAPAVIGGDADGLYPAVIPSLISGTEYELSIGLGGTTETVITQFNIQGADQELLSIAEADYLTKTGINQYGLPYTVEPITLAGVVNDFSGNTNHGAIKNSPCFTRTGTSYFGNPENFFITKADFNYIGCAFYVKIDSVAAFQSTLFRSNSGISSLGWGALVTNSSGNIISINPDGTGSGGVLTSVGAFNYADSIWRRFFLYIDYSNVEIGATGGTATFKLYIDGVEVTTYTASITNPFSSNSMRSGFYQFFDPNPSSTNGSLSDCRIYASNSDIQTLATAEPIATFDSRIKGVIPFVENAGTKINQINLGLSSTPTEASIISPNAATDWATYQNESTFLQAKGGRKYEYTTQSQIDFEIGAGVGITRTNGYTFAFDGSSGTQYIQPDATVSGMQDLIDTLLEGVEYTIQFTILNYVAGVLTLDVGGDISNTYAVNGAVIITLNASTTSGQLRFSSFNFEGDLEITSIVCNTIFPADLSNVGFDVLGNALPVGYGKRFFDFGQSIERKATPVTQTFATCPPPIVSDTDYGAEDTTQATASKWGLVEYVAGAGTTIDAEIDKLIALSENPAPKIIKRV